LDAAYRKASGCTLYTLEMHLHFLSEVKREDTVQVALRILAADAKRIHAALELSRTGDSTVAAAAEVMLLHVRQR
jgi:acyl-CoA thioester hydrolase